jgi:hypothetical protein
MSFPVVGSLAAASSGYINLTVSQFPGFNINIVLTTFTGSGVLSVKYLNQFSDTGSTSASWQTIAVVGGSFLNGQTTYSLVSGSVVTSPYIQLSWAPSGTVTGSFTIQGVNI